MNFKHVTVIFISGILISGCTLDISTSSSATNPDKPVFKTLQKYKISGDFSAPLHTLEQYKFSASDDAGNLYLMGTTRLNDRIVMRAITPNGQDKINFGRQGYLYPSTAITVLEASYLTAYSLEVFTRTGQPQLATVFGTQSSSYVGVNRGLKIMLFSHEGTLLQSGPSITLPNNQSLNGASITSTPNNFYLSLTNSSGVYILKTDLQGSPDLSFGQDGFLKIPSAFTLGKISDLDSDSAMMITINPSAIPICYKIKSDGTFTENTLDSLSPTAPFQAKKLNDNLFLAITPDLKIFGVDGNCQLSSTINTAVSNYSTDYVLAGLSRTNNESADIALVKKSNREVVSIRFNSATLVQTPTILPAMPLAPSRTDTTNKYAAHYYGNKLTLMSFEDSLLAGVFNNLYNSIKETSMHRYDISTQSFDTSWGSMGHRELNEKGVHSLLETAPNIIAEENFIYFKSNYINDSYNYSNALFRTSTKGILDTSFGVNGFIHTNSSIQHVIETESSDILAFISENGNSKIQKLKPNGIVDTTFANAGSYLPPNGTYIRSDIYLLKKNRLYFLSGYSPVILRCLDIDTGNLIFDNISMPGNRALTLYSDLNDKVFAETVSGTYAPDPTTTEISIHEISLLGGLTLRQKIEIETDEELTYSIEKGTTLYYTHSPELNDNVTLHLTTFNGNGSHRSNTSSVFKKFITGSMSYDIYNGMPYAYGIFDGGTYFYGRVITYDTNGNLYERLFDSLEIQNTFTSKNNKLYMTERKPSLNGNTYYLIPLESHEFEKVQK